MQTTTFSVGGMTCQHCVQSVTNALASLAGVQHVDVSLADQQVTVTHTAEAAGLAQFQQAVRDIGFETP